MQLLRPEFRCKLQPGVFYFSEIQHSADMRSPDLCNLHRPREPGSRLADLDKFQAGRQPAFDAHGQLAAPQVMGQQFNQLRV